MTPREFAEVKARHGECEDAVIETGDVHCARCAHEEAWPCDAVRLAVRMEELEAKIALALQQADYGARHGAPAQDTLDSVLSALGGEDDRAHEPG